MGYHEGELAVQRRAGVRELAERVGGIVNDEIHPAMAAFLAARPFLIVATVAIDGQPIASFLGGPPGFAIATNPRTVAIAPRSGHRERVFADVEASGRIGILAIDPATRRRMRINGNASRAGEQLLVSTEEVYGNCPQYINPTNRIALRATGAATTSAALSPTQQQWIATADTFFLASAHPERGADASHRGGPPGFVTVDGPSRLHWPDFRGNNMFNSLGNLAVNPKCGLLFVDFASGAMLQVLGRAIVEGDEEREVIVEIDAVIETR